MLNVISLCCLSLVGVLFVSSPASESAAPDRGKVLSSNRKDPNQKHVILLGASIGKAWNIPSLAERIQNSDYFFEYVGTGWFDKSEYLQKILSRKDDKPDAIFLKQCAAYFPEDLEKYKDMMRQWIGECQKGKVIPIPTTVVPVTRIHAYKKFLIDIIKLRNPFKFGNPFRFTRNRAILQYNDWVREYSERNGLTYLDLESALRYSETNRYLREDFAKIDGLHLNSKAYKNLDQIVLPALKRIDWDDLAGH